MFNILSCACWPSVYLLCSGETSVDALVVSRFGCVSFTHDCQSFSEERADPGAAHLTLRLGVWSLKIPSEGPGHSRPTGGGEASGDTRGW